MRLIDADKLTDGKGVFTKYIHTDDDFNTYVYVEDIINVIEKHETVGDGWIPCEERLPEAPFGCLVTIIATNPMTLEDYTEVLPYVAGYDEQHWVDTEGDAVIFEVIAWKPLPEPYTE